MQATQAVLKQVAIATTGVIGGGLVALWQASKNTPFQPPDSIGFPSLTIGDNYLATLQTGDLVFFNTPVYVPKPVKWFLSTMARHANQGEFEHMGIVVNHPTHNYPYIFEYTWLGPVVSTFEDRIGYSNSQDVLLRTLHMVRDQPLNVKAQEFLEEELIKSQNSLSIFNRWLLSIKQMALISYLNTISPRASHELQRFIPLDELHTLLSIAAQPDTPENMAQKDRLAELQSITSQKETKQTMSHNRVSLYGELLGLLSQLRTIEANLRRHLQAAEESKTHPTDTGSDGVSPSSPNVQTTQATPETTPPAAAAAPAAKGELTAHETMLILQRRNQLYRQFELKYDEYRQKTVEILHQKHFSMSPFAQGASPTFYDADLVARLFTHIGVLPESTFDTLPKEKFDEVFPQHLPKLEEHMDEHDLRQYDFSKIHQTLLSHAPHPREYRPHNFRMGVPLALKRGILGEEQYIVQGFNKPPLEYRTGVNAFEDWDVDRH